MARAFVFPGQGSQAVGKGKEMAVMRVLETEKGIKLADVAKFVAGHFLGEYSALTAAGAFSLADTYGRPARRRD